MKSENLTLLERLDEVIDSETIDEAKIRAVLKESRKSIKRFDTILKQSDKQLSQQVHQLEEEFELRVHSERILAQQAKHAAMGEMMDAVAHQWKQPLNAISMLTDLLLIEYREGEVDEAYLKNYKKVLWEQIDHLLNTLTEFRSFFRPDKEKRDFNIRHAIDSVLLLIKDEFLKEMISFIIEGDERLELYGVENEFKHIILNILNNAKDAFKENAIASRKISFDIYQESDMIILEICDNAGGIPASVIETIFKANVTTKAEGKGTGIGLYMSAQIAEKMAASLTVTNRDDGACFSFKSQKSKGGRV
ncbi:MAG: HAMP domain-containing sensor histidine kinase [Campylobacterota bacterium]|nr:HAMP domain-containing sensor histidine kinase [Campylobacterota bacterium]